MLEPITEENNKHTACTPQDKVSFHLYSAADMSTAPLITQ